MRTWRKGNLEFKVSADQANDEAQRIAYRFVKDLLYEVASHCVLFNSTTYDFCDLPYDYRERQLDAVLAPAISKLCNGYIMTEIPVTRKKKDDDDQRKESSGRGDYWCIYKGYTFVIELKHSRDRYQYGTTRRDTTIESWQTMIKQLKDAASTYKEFEETTYGVIRLGLHFKSSCPSYDYDENLTKDFRKDIELINDRITKDIKDHDSNTKPDMSICWLIPENIVEKDDMSIPGLWAFVKYFKPLKHKGYKERKK